MNRRRRHRADRRTLEPAVEPALYTCPWCGAVECAHCPWCGVSTPDHTLECPVELGIYPVDDETIGTSCGGECGSVFVDGDQYAYEPNHEGRFTAVCLGCSAATHCE